MTTYLKLLGVHTPVKQTEAQRYTLQWDRKMTELVTKVQVVTVSMYTYHNLWYTVITKNNQGLKSCLCRVSGTKISRH